MDHDYCYDDHKEFRDLRIIIVVVVVVIIISLSIYHTYEEFNHATNEKTKPLEKTQRVD